MYRVIVVDDEEPVLDSFTFIIEQDAPDFVLCGKARSGREAVQLISQEIPDLVFMDIQMPGIDGIETIKQVRKQFPDILFILATAYERFDIAQKVIPLGVFSYLVKPITRKVLQNELIHVKAHLDSLREKSSLQLEEVQLLKKTKEDVKHKFLSSLMWKSPTKAEWDEFSRLFSIHNEIGVIYILEVLNITSEDIRQDLYSKISETIQYKYNCFSTCVGEHVLFFFPEERPLQDLDGYMQSLLLEFEPYQFKIGNGGICHYSHLADSFSRAFKESASHTREKEAYSNKKNKMREVCRTILKSSREKALTVFEEYWTEIFFQYPFDIAKSKMISLFTLLLYDLDVETLAINNFNFDPAEEITPLETIEAWQQWSSHIIGIFIDMIQNNQSQSYPKPLAMALAYIIEHYNQSLQLSDVADECNISASYLSRLFSEHLNTTFIEHLNQFRINKALILLKEKEKTVKEISYLVGYQDPNYFTRIFRRYMGISPSNVEKMGANHEF